MKKILCILLTLCLLFGLVSCGGPTEEEILPVIEKLLEDSKEVNEICFGEGIAFREDGFSIGAYHEANANALSAYDIKTVADIEQKLRAVYSKETADWIVSVVLNAVMVESGVQNYARYYDYEEKDKNGVVTKRVLMVHGNYDPLTVGTAEYHDVRVVESKKEHVVFTMDITVTLDGKIQRIEDGEYTLRLEDGVWLLGTATYATFDKSQ